MSGFNVFIILVIASLQVAYSSDSKELENSVSLSAQMIKSYDEMSLAWINAWQNQYDLDDESERLKKFVIKRANSTGFIIRFLESDGSKTICPEFNKRCIAFIDDIAVMQTYQALDVYMRWYVVPNDQVKNLFETTNDFETEMIISWISNEVNISDLPKKKNETANVKLEPSDKIYFYKSPPFSWENSWGRQGYAVFREGELVDNIVTLMN